MASGAATSKEHSGKPKEPRLINCCYMKCSVAWIITVEAAICLLYIATATYCLVKWNTAEYISNSPTRKDSDLLLPIEVIVAIVVVIIFTLGLLFCALLGRSVSRQDFCLLIPYLCWKLIMIMALVPAIISLCLAMTVLPNYCGGFSPKFSWEDAQCIAISVQMGVVSAYFVISIIFLIYAFLLLSYFRKLAAQNAAQVRAAAIQRKLSTGAYTTMQRRMLPISSVAANGVTRNGNATLTPSMAPTMAATGIYGTLGNVTTRRTGNTTSFTNGGAHFNGGAHLNGGIGSAATIARTAAYPPIYGTIRPPPAPQYRQYGSSQLSMGYYYT